MGRLKPVPAFRETLRETLKTKAGRAEADRKANPIERPEDVARLVDSAAEEDPQSSVAVLLLLDTGRRRAARLLRAGTSRRPEAGPAVGTQP